MACIQCQYQWCWLCGDQWSDSHFTVCSEFRKWYQDLPLLVIVFCLTAPISIPFFSVFILGMYGVSLDEDEDASLTTTKCAIVLLLAVLTLPFSPVVLILVLFGAPVALAVKSCKECYCGEATNVLGVLLIFVYLAVMICVLLLTAALLMVAGVVMLFTKVWVNIRKCYAKHNDARPNYNSMW
jgi:hypothetical protein